MAFGRADQSCPDCGGSGIAPGTNPFRKAGDTLRYKPLEAVWDPYLRKSACPCVGVTACVDCHGALRVTTGGSALCSMCARAAAQQEGAGAVGSQRIAREGSLYAHDAGVTSDLVEGVWLSPLPPPEAAPPGWASQEDLDELGVKFTARAMFAAAKELGEHLYHTMTYGQIPGYAADPRLKEAAGRRGHGHLRCDHYWCSPRVVHLVKAHNALAVAASMEAPHSSGVGELIP